MVTDRQTNAQTLLAVYHFTTLAAPMLDAEKAQQALTLTAHLRRLLLCLGCCVELHAVFGLSEK